MALGTFLSIEGRIRPPAAEGGRALDAACQVFEIVDEAMHPTRAGSDLVAIAGARQGALIPIHRWTFEVLTLAQQLWKDTDGEFDPCMPEQPGRLGDLELITPAVARASVRRRTGAEVSLDLGGIAKGFAIDRAVDVLRAAGCESGQVNAGGDVRVFGPQAAPMHIRVGGTVTTSLTLQDEALAVSEPKSAASPSEHRGFYSPRTGRPVTGRAVAVRASTAAIADALTKCAIVCEPEALQRLLRQYSARLVDLASPVG